MELFQFRHSAFCEKVHLLLAAKGLSYSVNDVTPGVGQIELFQLTGQRQVPVLRDGEQLIADSSAIAMHLESKHPDPALLPTDAAQRAEVLLLEDWADTALASTARMALLQGAAEDPVLRGALLPETAAVTFEVADPSVRSVSATADFTEATAPSTITLTSPAPARFCPANVTSAVFSIASSASTAAANPRVSIMPNALICDSYSPARYRYENPCRFACESTP